MKGIMKADLDVHECKLSNLCVHYSRKQQLETSPSSIQTDLLVEGGFSYGRGA